MTEPSHTRGPAASRRRDSRYQRARRRSPRTARRALALARPTARRTFCNHEQLPSRVSVYPRRRRGMNPPRLTAAARIRAAGGPNLGIAPGGRVGFAPNAGPPRDSQVRRGAGDGRRTPPPKRPSISRGPSPGCRHRLFLRLPLHRLEARRRLPCPRRRRRRMVRLARTGPPSDCLPSFPAALPSKKILVLGHVCTVRCRAHELIAEVRVFERRHALVLDILAEARGDSMHGKNVDRLPQQARTASSP